MLSLPDPGYQRLSNPLPNSLHLTVLNPVSPAGVGPAAGRRCAVPLWRPAPPFPGKAKRKSGESDRQGQAHRPTNHPRGSDAASKTLGPHAGDASVVRRRLPCAGCLALPAPPAAHFSINATHPMHHQRLQIFCHAAARCRATWVLHPRARHCAAESVQPE